MRGLWRKEELQKEMRERGSAGTLRLMESPQISGRLAANWNENRVAQEDALYERKGREDVKDEERLMASPEWGLAWRLV